MQNFFSDLHPDFRSKKIICELKLSLALLNNSKQNPWIILVPKVKNTVEFTDLTYSNQLLLLEEINIASKILKLTFNADKINIAMLGNVTPQLHCHVIARYKDSLKDKHFPNVLFNLEHEKMNENDLSIRAKQIADEFTSKMLSNSNK